MSKYRFTNRINYPSHSMRIEDDLWENIRMYRCVKKLTWHQLMREMLAAHQSIPVSETKSDSKSFNAA